MEKSEAPGIQKQSRPPTKKKSILVIDDSSDMLNLQKAFLEMDGFQTFTARSGEEAFKVLDKIEKPDLILLDVRMDGMSGPDFLKMLEDKKPEILHVSFGLGEQSFSL